MEVSWLRDNFFWLSFGVCLFPFFICVGYRRVFSFKKQYIEQILRGRTFETYKKAHAFQADASLEEVIESLFGPRYTVRSYVMPLTVDALVTAFGLLVFLIKMAPERFGGRVPEIDNLPAAFFYGLAGAFLWGLYDLLRRFQEADLAPICLCYITMRMFIVGILSSILPAVFSTGMTPLIAFSLGAFPIQTLLKFLKVQAKDKIKLDDDEAIVSPPDLHLLQGVTRRTLEQMDRLCIENVEQLAQTNPVRLLLQTNLDWEIILDLVDQAVLCMYMGGDRPAILGSMGIRCASDLASLYEGLCDAGDSNAKATVLFQEAASKLGLSITAFESITQNISWCPQVRFLRCLQGEMNRWTQSPEMGTVPLAAIA